jgi:dTDP-4-dehydrorhamnose 3,5-epimerase
VNVRDLGAGLLLFEPDVYRDHRGEFLETWRADRYAMVPRFVQDNRSVSRRGVVRGLHFQHPNGQGKLLSVAWGEILDVAVDIRVGSPTFGHWWAEVLSADNVQQLYVPPGFAHGFAVRSEVAVVSYKCTTVYSPGDDHTLLWNDPAVGIEWGVAEPVLSAKDRAGLRLDQLGDALPGYEPDPAA